MVSVMFELFMVLLFGVQWFCNLFQSRDALKWNLCRLAVQQHTKNVSFAYVGVHAVIAVYAVLNSWVTW
jgi:hypothetical protein